MTSKKHYGKQTGRPITHELPTPAGGVRLVAGDNYPDR